MPINILNLPAYSVTSFQENDHGYLVRAETVAPPKVCPHCRSDSIVGFGRREQMVKDLPIHGKRVGLYIDTRRFKCMRCSQDQHKKAIFYEALREIDAKRLMTKRLVACMGKQAINRTLSGIAEEVGCTEFTVRAVFSVKVAPATLEAPLSRGSGAGGEGNGHGEAFHYSGWLALNDH